LQHIEHSDGYVFVANAQDQKTKGSKREVTRRVVLGLRVVNGAINFDDHARGVTVKVRDEAVNELLPAEVKSAEFARAELIPKKSFRGCHLAAHLSSERDFVCVNLLAGDEVRHGWANGQTYPPAPPP
jgi:hypothetical protein